ncbi:MAG TPA: tail fiber protein [Niastella sp.]
MDYLGEIRIFSGNFAPANWALCQGQVLNISDYSLLYSLLGTRYGGDGVTTFCLPDLRVRVAVGAGQGASLSAYTQGQKGGTETVPLQTNNLPLHSHTVPTTIAMNCYSGEGNTDTPYNNYPAKITGTNMYATASDGSVIPNLQNDQNTSSVGNSIPVYNIQPVLGINFIICINGDVPPTI